MYGRSIMAKKYRVSHPPTPELSGVREFNLPSDRIQGNNDCMFCGSKTLSYKSICGKCKYAISPERYDKLVKYREGQVIAMEQEKEFAKKDKKQKKADRDWDEWLRQNPTDDD